MFPLSFPAASMLVLGAAVVLITPGPTNTLLAAAGLQRGVRRASPLIAAELSGYLIAISAWGSLLVHASNRFGALPTVLRAASAVYVATLAVRMWRSAAGDIAERGSPTRMKTLFVATLLNPKAMLFAGTIFPAAAFSDLPTGLQAMTLFAFSLVPIGFVWITLGAALGTGRLARLTPRRMQRAAAVVLSLFVAVLAWTVVR